MRGMRYFLLFYFLVLTTVALVAPLFASGPEYGQALNLYKRTDYQASLDLLLPVEPSWTVIRSDLDRLTSYAVEFRYPGTTADKAMACSAIDVCRDVRHRLRVSLGLTP